MLSTVLTWLAAVVGITVLVVLAASASAMLRLRRLFEDGHLLEIERNLSTLGLDARRIKDGERGDELPNIGPATFMTTAPVSVSYSIRNLDDGQIQHHVIVATPKTKARSAGARLLALIERGLGLDGEALYFVSQHHVFHMVHTLSPEADARQASAAAPKTRPPQRIRNEMNRDHARILGRMVETNVPQSILQPKLR